MEMCVRTLRWRCVYGLIDGDVCTCTANSCTYLKDNWIDNDNGRFQLHLLYAPVLPYPVTVRWHRTRLLAVPPRRTTQHSPAKAHPHQRNRNRIVSASPRTRCVLHSSVVPAGTHNLRDGSPRGTDVLAHARPAFLMPASQACSTPGRHRQTSGGARLRVESPPNFSHAWRDGRGARLCGAWKRSDGGDAWRREVRVR
jgi:hypothetical protein